MTINTHLISILVGILPLFLSSCGVATLPFRIIDRTKASFHLEKRRSDVEDATELALSGLSRTELQDVMDHNGRPLPDDSDQFKKVSALVQDIINHFRYPHVDLQHGAQLYIIPADEPIATSYYPNIILLSTSIINASSPCGTDDEAALLGVLSHEIVHIQLGHTRAKSINRAYANGLIRDYVGYTAFNVLTRMVPFSPRFIIHRESLDDLAFAEWYFESVADLLAMDMITAFGYDPESYVHYVHKLYENSAKGYCAYTESATAIDNRLGRLAAYVSGAPYNERTRNVRFISYEYGDVPHMFNSTPNIKVNRETANRILYWQYATLHNKEWCSVFMCFNTDLMASWGADPEIIEHFKDVRLTSLPIRINGFDSLIFREQPELLKQLVKTKGTQ